jgi:hypothetical protein
MKDEKRINDDDSFAPIQPYTSEELRALYKVKSRSTWYRWLKKHRAAIGWPVGRYYNNKQVRILFQVIDPPGPQQDEEKVVVKLK